MAEKSKQLLRRAFELLGALLRKEDISEDDTSDLYSDIGEYLEGYDVTANAHFGQHRVAR